MSLIEAVVAGHFCVDVYPDLSSFPPEKFIDILSPGRLFIIGNLDFGTGGAVSNTGQALYKLGINTRLMGRVGNDDLGLVAENIIGANDPILKENIVKGDEGTSYTLVLNPPGIDRILMHYPGSNDAFSSGDINYDLVANSKLFHFGYPPLMKLMYQDEGRHLIEMFKHAKETGVTVSLDMALPDPNSDAGKVDWSKILDAVLPYVDIFLPSIEEITFMLFRDLYEKYINNKSSGDISLLVTPEILRQVSDYILNRGVKIAVIKLGEYGLYARTGNSMAFVGMGRAVPTNLDLWIDREIWTACYRVNVAGTAGSGDATIAGFLAAMLRDLPLAGAVDMGVAVGACCVEMADTVGGIRSWDATMKRIGLGWDKHPLNITGDWEFNPEYKVYERKLSEFK